MSKSKENCRFDRYTVSYLDISRTKHSDEYETLYKATEHTKELMNDRNVGFPRNPDPEKAGMTITHEIYYGIKNLHNHMPNHSNVIYTAYLHDAERLNELQNQADFIPEVGEIYVCGNMESLSKSFAVVKEVDIENNTITFDSYRKNMNGKIQSEPQERTMELDGKFGSFTSLYHLADEYAEIEFEAEKEQKTEQKGR